MSDGEHKARITKHTRKVGCTDYAYRIERTRPKPMAGLVIKTRQVQRWLRVPWNPIGPCPSAGKWFSVSELQAVEERKQRERARSQSQESGKGPKRHGRHEVIPHVTCLSPHLLCRRSMTRTRERHPHSSNGPPSDRRSLMGYAQGQAASSASGGPQEARAGGYGHAGGAHPAVCGGSGIRQTTSVPGIRLRRRPARTKSNQQWFKVQDYAPGHRNSDSLVSQRPLCQQ